MLFRSPPSTPATIRFYDAPASHNLPWQLTQLNDRPGEPIWARFIEDVTVWIPTVWPTDPRVR